MATDKPARAMKCPQCNAMVLLGQVNGFKVAVDIAPLTVEQYREELIAGRDVYAFVRGKLRPTGRGSWNHPLESRKREHPCRAFGSVTLDAPEAARPRPVCDVRRAAGWKAPPDCLRASEAGAQRFRSCQHCEPPPFDRPTTPVGPFDAHRALVDELGARVVSIEVDGREIYRDESLA